MVHVIEQAKCLIFDLDGTLYEDVAHFQLYADLLQQQVNQKHQNDFEYDYKNILKGEHPLKVGTVYDMKSDTIIAVDPFTNKVKTVTSWEGEDWLQERVEMVYPDYIQYGFERMIAIGDGWWLPFAVAMHYGVGMEEARECYDQTKEYMTTEAFEMSKTKGLKAALEQWRKEKLLILLTNSESQDVENILDRIGLTNLFHHTIPSAYKPQKTALHYESILKRHQLEPSQIVSIGDNILNEIAPALRKGMKAVLVQPTGEVELKHPDRQVVTTLADVCS
ncbi:phosphoglycolate phosphatase [Halobacillus karajensis]|uniref:Phosphoglycolate phosphatase n=1 Tax=Halobacillus karajensis TaxID=195088 RepID=A0A024P8Z0_9BACI|nr:phosphoglycolate phosphatase [Halobacillus karajensis]CDQ24887.1 phosphoglycolate phosphatase [Halobacillus karajensis]CDQ28753.1 phosphoglycolate phosphatase [Halobacillus karajensis]